MMAAKAIIPSPPKNPRHGAFPPHHAGDYLFPAIVIMIFLGSSLKTSGLAASRASKRRSYTLARFLLRACARGPSSSWSSWRVLAARNLCSRAALGLIRAAWTTMQPMSGQPSSEQGESHRLTTLDSDRACSQQKNLARWACAFSQPMYTSKREEQAARDRKRVRLTRQAGYTKPRGVLQ